MISPRMQALLIKVDAAEAEHYAGLRESAQQDTQKTKAKPLADRRRPGGKRGGKSRWRGISDKERSRQMKAVRAGRPKRKTAAPGKRKS